MLEAPLLSVVTVTVVLVVADGSDVTLEDGGPRRLQGCHSYDFSHK